MARLACAFAALGVLGLLPMATAAMAVALLGVGLGSLALYQLNHKADEARASGERNRRMLNAGADRSSDD